MTSDVKHFDSTNWPTRLYLGTLIFAEMSLVLVTPALDGAAMNAGRAIAQFGICIVLGLRLAWAIRQREQSKVWIPYIIGMLLAVPIWLVIEPWVLSLG